jgi:hypothetical protein
MLRLLLPFGLAMMVLALPMFLLAVAGKRSRNQGLPRAVGFLRSYASLALPVASLLLVGYVAVALVTLRLEATKRTEIERTLTNENLYLADIVHQRLPGFCAGQAAAASSEDHAGSR